VRAPLCKGGYFFFFSGVLLLECCPVADTLPENTVVGLPPSWVDTDVCRLKTTQNCGLGAKSSPQGKIFRILPLRFNSGHRLIFFRNFMPICFVAIKCYSLLYPLQNMHPFYPILRPFGWHWYCVEPFGCHWSLHPADQFLWVLRTATIAVSHLWQNKAISFFENVSSYTCEGRRRLIAKKWLLNFFHGTVTLYAAGEVNKFVTFWRGLPKNVQIGDDFWTTMYKHTTTTTTTNCVDVGRFSRRWPTAVTRRLSVATSSSTTPTGTRIRTLGRPRTSWRRGAG